MRKKNTTMKTELKEKKKTWKDVSGFGSDAERESSWGKREREMKKVKKIDPKKKMRPE